MSVGALLLGWALLSLAAAACASLVARALRPHGD